MNVSEGIEQLKNLCKEKNWFSNVEFDGRYIVYVHFMNMETITFIPISINDKQVVVHFASSLKLIEINKIIIEDLSEDVEFIEEGQNLAYLIEKLDKLKRDCGLFTLQSIFFETHDKKNAVTNISDRYPEIKKEIEELYNQYGFDVLYDEIGD